MKKTKGRLLTIAEVKKIAKEKGEVWASYSYFKDKKEKAGKVIEIADNCFFIEGANIDIAFDGYGDESKAEISDNDGHTAFHKVSVT